MLTLLLLACGPKDPILQADRTSLDFIVVDDGNDQLHRVDQVGGHSWSVDIPSGARDIIRWDATSVLVSHYSGATRYAIADGEVLWDVDGYADIGSAIPQPQDAVTLFGQYGNQLKAFSVDRHGVQSADRTFPNYKETRIVRELPDDHLLFTHGEPWQMVEIDGFATVIWAVRLPWRGHQAIKSPDGTYLVSTCDNLQVRRFSRQGQTLSTLDGAADKEAYNLAWFAGFDEVGSVGYTVVANWLAMADDPSVGAHLVAFDSAGKIQWSWDDHDLASTVTGVVVLEGFTP